VNGPELMPAVVRRLDGAGIAVGELTLRRSSLDEVFLALTGHRAEPGDGDGRGGGDTEPDDSDIDKVVSSA
jgi:oleandomycin transport system ATP-binding protein